jgi:hypothetical protein
MQVFEDNLFLAMRTKLLFSVKSVGNPIECMAQQLGSSFFLEPIEVHVLLYWTTWCIVYTS